MNLDEAKRKSDLAIGASNENDYHPLALLLLGLGLLLLPIPVAGLAPTTFDHAQFFLRLIAALGGALVGGAIPGALQLNVRGIKAAGALAIFVLIWVIDPGAMTKQAAVSQTAASPGAPAMTAKIEGDQKISGSSETHRQSAKRVGPTLPIARTIPKPQVQHAAATSPAPSKTRTKTNPLCRDQNSRARLVYWLRGPGSRMQRQDSIERWFNSNGIAVEDIANFYQSRDDVFEQAREKAIKDFHIGFVPQGSPVFCPDIWLTGVQSHG